MAIKKSELSKLNKVLSKYNIRSKSINSASEHFNVTQQFIRAVLIGSKSDNHGVIDYLVDCVMTEKERISKLSSKIDKL